MTDIIKVFILSIVEGVTEFLPISSTGHLILVNEVVGLSPKSFSDTFSVIIQLGAIMSVVVLYFDRFNFLDKKKSVVERAKIADIIKKVIVGFLPAAVLGALFDDIIENYLFNPVVVALMLFFWGIVIIIIESKNKNKAKIDKIEDITYKKAIQIGFMQCFAMIPGTSRSAATIIGAMLLGSSRSVATEFSFFLAIPTMMGATGYKMLKIIIKGSPITLWQIFLIVLGTLLSFVVALIVIKRFMKYIQNNDFKIFGYYRVALSVIVLLYFVFIK